MWQKIRNYLLCFCSIWIISLSVSAQEFPIITFYTATFIPCFDQNNNLFIAIRTYFYNGKPYYLVVNPATFETQAAPVTNFKSRMVTSDPTIPGYYTMAALKGTPYVNALSQYFSPPYHLKNYGIVHAAHPVDGYFLTVDMCPSVKPFEQAFFSMLVRKSDNDNQPIPVAISVTGLWIIGHPDEFSWLTQREKANKLKITWINHTYDHVYYRDLPFDNNFLLTTLDEKAQGSASKSSQALSNIKFEVLFTEQLLLQRGELPSVFFRFPGLISNEKLVLQLQKLGLIPIGTDSWLNKLGTTDANSDEEEKHEAQPTTLGSIILVHGNSNEHAGIELAMPLVQPATFRLLPLNQSF